jgi:hypothetical protein
MNVAGQYEMSSYQWVYVSFWCNNLYKNTYEHIFVLWVCKKKKRILEKELISGFTLQQRYSGPGYVPKFPLSLYRWDYNRISHPTLRAYAQYRVQ